MLCTAMEIKVPSLYAAFGSKEQLFLEAVQHYEKKYWTGAWVKLNCETDVFRAVPAFFLEAARILSSNATSCGCMVVLGATNVSVDGQVVNSKLKAMRKESERRFLNRIRLAIVDGQVSEQVDAVGLAATLNTLLEGMSVQARDGATMTDLERIARLAACLLPRWSVDGMTTVEASLSRQPRQNRTERRSLPG